MVIGMLVLAAVALGYHVTLHAPLWAKFGIPAGSMVIVSGFGALFRCYRAKRLARQRTMAESLLEAPSQQQEGSLGKPGKRKRETNGDSAPDPDPRRP